MTRVPLLETLDLTIGYHRPRHAPRIVAEGIEVALGPGEFVCLLGPNGGGKSTLIRTLSGMQQPLAGSIHLCGKPLSSLAPRTLAQHMSLVLTERVAVGMMPVATLVALGRHPYTDWTGRLGREDKKAVHRAMGDVGIELLAHRPVCELSDGERQKVMIARALAQEPQIMVLDEPTAFLDLPRRVELMHLLRNLAHDGQRAVLLSTHDLDLALRCADRLWLLPPGGPLHDGIPEDLVLNDTFSETFADSGVCFDKSAGAFSLNGVHRGTVALKGNGIPGMWTYRALERAGYRVIPDGGSEPCVEVIRDSSRTAWRIYGRTGTYSSIESLLADLALHQTEASKDVDRG
ncbi:MAG: ABC transporter ATP-binding protein [Syntrophobacteraceae bacterium]|nr:ABC transporter ATP-binding protein [Syntrophobacteraceae bacterium]